MFAAAAAASGIAVLFILIGFCQGMPEEFDGFSYRFQDSFMGSPSYYDLDHKRRSDDLDEKHMFFNYSNSPFPFDSRDDENEGPPAMRAGNSSDDGERPRRIRRFPPRSRRRFFQRNFHSMLRSGIRPLFVPYPMPYFYHQNH